MPHFICRECGTQYAETEAPPDACPICEDERQYVRWEGQAWTTLEEIRASHSLRWEEEGAGLIGIGSTPSFAIGQRALLVEAADGNVLWDCISLIDDEIVERIEARGGLKAIAISHPHYYTTMVEWSEAFGGIPIYIHADDMKWVQRLHPSIVAWSGETHALSPSLTLIRCGGHFEGGAVLHWADGAEGQGALLTGDILQVVQDRRHVSFMYSYPNLIPVNAAAVERIRDSLVPYGFDSIFGAWWKRNIVGNARQAFDISVERYLDAIR
ncbi:MBL fold metallo-hydrolase [Microvirga sp. GCM10011540]|uniref:MBL fold metallo-hydrolase n=1 Tax=Microvirga sp. GCM10011540 TaxID=3317338 RepID=UPI00361F176A